MSLELGYRGALADRLVLETTLFAQDKYDLLQNDINAAAYPGSTENLLDLRQGGVESSLQALIAPGWITLLDYTWTRTLDVSLTGRGENFPAHLGEITLQSTASREWELQASVEFASSYQFSGSRIGPRGSAIGELQERPGRTMFNARLGRRLFDGRAEIYLAGRHLLAPLQQSEDLVELQIRQRPIGATVMLGVRLLTTEDYTDN